MKKEVINNYIEAGKIAKKALNDSLKMIDEGVKIIDVVEKAEEIVKSLGAGLAFPVNFSINENAAHDTAARNDDRVIKQGDVIKLDIGAHIDGYIADTARTKAVNTDKYDLLIKASEEALNEAIKIMKPGITISEIGKTIELNIKKYGFQPIINLSGHLLEQYELHAGLTIPNYENSSTQKIEKGYAVAIEPFACTGMGRVVEGKSSLIYRLIKNTGARMPVERQIIKIVEDEYKSLPFSKRAVENKLKRDLTLAFNNLVKNEVLQNYPILRESTRGIVSQAEHTVLILDKIIVTTA